eukprot:CAMPEP_0113538524 /NCGR_PEP_ID=MMETSP0015_2-20120614/7411_1 /TAXON_ID=2838 /ORGANISM="Odontella" /LENGTH=163 /DNA_ID=CAMNT_0000438103 /DNA_START=34 /DNA_END=521 /DNA_ORIENTATION=- /assembly_acc=CAM_ASM_000160
MIAAAMALFWGREFPEQNTRKDVMAVTLDTRRATIDSALRLSAAVAMVRTKGARSSDSGDDRIASGSTRLGIGSLMNLRKESVVDCDFFPRPTDIHRAEVDVEVEEKGVVVGIRQMELAEAPVEGGTIHADAIGRVAADRAAHTAAADRTKLIVDILAFVVFS